MQTDTGKFQKRDARCRLVDALWRQNYKKQTVPLEEAKKDDNKQQRALS